MGVDSFFGPFGFKLSSDLYPTFFRPSSDCVVSTKKGPFWVKEPSKIAWKKLNIFLHVGMVTWDVGSANGDFVAYEGFVGCGCSVAPPR